MAEAQFTPYLPPGGIVDAAFSGANQMQSLMARGQQMRESAEAAQRQQEIYEIGRPVMEAKAQADLAVAQGTLYNARQIQQLRGQFGNQSKEASAEYEKAMQLPSYEEQAKALSDVAQKYSYFELIPEGKPFIHTVQNMQLQQHNSAILNSKGQQALDRERLRAEGNLTTVAAKGEEQRATDAAAGKGRSKEANDYIYASSIADENPQLAEQLRQHAINMAARKAGGSELIQTEERIANLKKDPNADPRELQDLVNRAHTISLRAQKQATFLIMEDARKAALERGDEAEARRIEAKQIHDSGGDASSYPVTPAPVEQPGAIKKGVEAVKDFVTGSETSPDVEIVGEPIPAAKEPTFPAGTATVTFQGKRYPTRQNGKGEAAFYKDGHWHLFKPLK